MQRTLKNAGLLVIGSVLVFCGQTLVTDTAKSLHENGSTPAGSMTPESPTEDEAAGMDAAHAQAPASCPACPRPAPVVLFDGVPPTIHNPNASTILVQTPALNVQGYRSIVIHSTTGIHVEFRFGAAGWVKATSYVNEEIVTFSPDWGNELRVNYQTEKAAPKAITIVAHP